MLIKKAAVLGASIVLTLGLASTNTYAWHTHWHYAKTICRGGTCHKYVRNVTRRCGAGGCRTYRNHFHWSWRR